VDGGNRRTANYGHLTPGKYQFQVIACNNDGVWNEKGAALRIQLMPFLWQRPWFEPLVWSGGAGIMGAIVFMAVRRRNRLQVAALERDRALNRERGRIAQDLHDDLGASLTEISLIGGMAQRPNITLDRYRQHLAEITAKSGEMVAALDEIVWAVNPQHDSVSSLQNYLCQYAQHLLRLTPIRCRLEVSKTLPNLALNSELRHGLFLAFKEALTNVIQHSQASEVRISILTQDDCLCVSVDDNGKGCEPGLPRAGADGMGNMRRRLEQIGGQCEIKTQKGVGTGVCFRLPLAKLNPATKPLI